MPELPEVETVRRGLEPVMVGDRFDEVLCHRPDLRFPFPERFGARLSGQRIQGLRRRAKYLLADLEGGETLVMHLGMSGRFLIEGASLGETSRFHRAPAVNPVHDHVIFHLSAGARVVFNDPRRFGFMDLAPTDGLEQHKLFAHLGPEPLSNGFNEAYLSERLAGRLTPIKAALLDQQTVVGVGNIYACEALFRARISPRRLAGNLGPKRVGRLVGAVREVLAEAIEAGGSSLRDFASASGELGYFQHRFAVYDRAGEACRTPGCGGSVERIVQANRSSFFCPRCQR